MCGQFTRYNSREEYLASPGEEAERDIPYDQEPIGRYNFAPGTKVLQLNERSSKLHLDYVYWGCCPEWWNNPTLINTRSETAANNRIFRLLKELGQAIIALAGGWFEWTQQNIVKQPFFIYLKDRNPLLLADIGKLLFKNGNGQEGFLIVTATANEGVLDIDDRRPLVYPLDVTRKRLSENTTGKEAEDIAREDSLSVEDFTCPPSAGLLTGGDIPDIHSQGYAQFLWITHSLFYPSEQ